MIRHVRMSLILGLLLATLSTFAWTGIASAHPTTNAVPTTLANNTCLGGGFFNGPFTLEENTTFALPGGPPWFVKRSLCNDINVNFSQLTASMQMQVCFISTNTCNSWKTVSQTGMWYVIASSVRNLTQYRFGIRTTSEVTYKMHIADGS
jgi:hypothetical protein